MSTITNSQSPLFGGPNTQNGLQQLLQDRRNQAAPIDSGNNVNLMNAHKQALSEITSDRTQTTIGQMPGSARVPNPAAQDPFAGLMSNPRANAESALAGHAAGLRDRGPEIANENAMAAHANIRNMGF